MGRPKSELKKMFFGIEAGDGLNPVTIRDDFFLLRNLGQGVVGSNLGVSLGSATEMLRRIGDKVFVEYIYFNLVFQRFLLAAEVAANVSGNIIMRFRMCEWVGVGPAVGTFNLVFGSSAPVDTVANPIFSRTNGSAANLKRVIFDKRWTLAPDFSQIPATVAGAQPTYQISPGNNPTIKIFRKKIRIRKLIKYQVDNVVGPPFIPVNRDYTIHWQSESITDGAITVDGYITVAFRDA